MIQCRLRELMAIKGREERRRVTYDEILARTGIAKTTLSKLANERVGMVGLSVIDRICDYFDCQPGDLFIYIRESDPN
jgi:putative transcriptional regulator